MVDQEDREFQVAAGDRSVQSRAEVADITGLPPRNPAADFLKVAGEDRVIEPAWTGGFRREEERVLLRPQKGSSRFMTAPPMAPLADRTSPSYHGPASLDTRGGAIPELRLPDAAAGANAFRWRLFSPLSHGNICTTAREKGTPLSPSPSG